MNPDRAPPKKYRCPRIETAHAEGEIQSIGRAVPNTESKRLTGFPPKLHFCRSHKRCRALNSCRPPKHACLIIELTLCEGDPHGENRNSDGRWRLPWPDCGHSRYCA